MYKYDTQELNCHKYAQDIWNFCVIFKHQVWWRPDMIKAKLFGGLFGRQVDEDYDEYDDDYE